MNSISEAELEKAFDKRFPQEVKEKLRQAKVAIAGLGGLGSNIAVMLARTGVGHLLLVDMDFVDITNINRQVYSLSHIGMKKTDAIVEILRDINPYLTYEVKHIRVTSDNVRDLFEGYPIVCEAFDQAEEKSMLISQLLSQFSDVEIVSGNGMAGYSDANEIKTQRSLGRLYICGDGTTDIADGIGLMAPRVNICAGHQANKVIELILNE